MARRTTFAALACLLAVALPAAAFGQEEETDELPSYAAEELEAARAAGLQVDPNAEARAIPPPPNEISQPREQPLPRSSQPRQDVDFDTFYTELADHGTWVETPEYGWVFIPHRQAEVRDWRPYFYGRWIWTVHGWTWVSEEPFGWATYHYGRWAVVPAYGWVWVPGYVWGPAWVAWRWGDVAIGWAPLYPGYVTYTVHYPHHHHHWIYIGPRYFYAHPVHHHHHHFHRAAYYYQHTHRGHHWHGHPGHGGRRQVYAGPPRSHVQRHAPTRIVETRLHRTSHRPSREAARMPAGRAPERVEVYRPERRVASARGDRIPPNVRAPRVGSGFDAPRRVQAEGGAGARLRTAPRGNVPAGRTEVREPAVRAAPRSIPTPRAQPAPRSGRDLTAPRAAPGAPRVEPRTAPSTPRVAPQPPSRTAPRTVEPPRVRERAPAAPTTPRVSPQPRTRTAPRAVEPPRIQERRSSTAPGTQRIEPSAPRSSIAAPPSAARFAPSAPRGAASAERLQHRSTPRASNAPKIAPRSSGGGAPRLAPNRSASQAPRAASRTRSSGRDRR